MLRLKTQGFSDARLAELTGMTEAEVASRAHGRCGSPVYQAHRHLCRRIPVTTPYMYSTYRRRWQRHAGMRSRADGPRQGLILGGGPNRIGQGIEFDYCCVHAVLALSEAGYETIMVNCNPETVSTDYDTSDRLYFEPLTAEDVLELVRAEQRKGDGHGRDRPVRRSDAAETGSAGDAGVPILGTSPDAIDLAEDRERFQHLLKEARPAAAAKRHGNLSNRRERIAEEVGYPW